MMECRYCGRHGSPETCKGCGAPYDLRSMADPAYARNKRVNIAIGLASTNTASIKTARTSLGLGPREGLINWRIDT